MLWQARGDEHLPFASVRSDPRSAEPEGARDRAGTPTPPCAHYREAIDAAGLAPDDFRCADDLAGCPSSAATSWRRRRSASPRRATSTRRPSRCTRAAPAGARRWSTTPRTRSSTRSAHGRRQRAVFAHFLDRRRSGYREMRAQPHRIGRRHQLRRFYEANAWISRAVDLQRARRRGRSELRAGEIRRSTRFGPEVFYGYGSLRRRSLPVGLRARARAARAESRVVRGRSHGGRRP